MKKFELKAFVKDLNNNTFVRQCEIPLGYKACFPIIKTKGDKVLLDIPYNRIQRTATPGVSAVFPIAYTVTFELFAVKSVPEGIKGISKEPGYCNAKPVGFETLAYSKAFEKVPFGKAIEVFPHEELKKAGREKYEKKVERLYENYDAIINCLLGIEKAAETDTLELNRNLGLLVGPVTKQLYRLIDKDFYEKYLKDS